MLAAAEATPDRPLDLLRLALTLKSREQACPRTLKEHYNAVVEEAHRIADAGELLNSSTMPESISLAVLMRVDETLKGLLKPMRANGEITSTDAVKALQSIEVIVESGSSAQHSRKALFAAF